MNVNASLRHRLHRLIAMCAAVATATMGLFALAPQPAAQAATMGDLVLAEWGTTTGWATTLLEDGSTRGWHSVMYATVCNPTDETYDNRSGPGSPSGNVIGEISFNAPGNYLLNPWVFGGHSSRNMLELPAHTCHRFTHEVLGNSWLDILTVPPQPFYLSMYGGKRYAWPFKTQSTMSTLGVAGPADKAEPGQSIRRCPTPGGGTTPWEYHLGSPPEHTVCDMPLQDEGFNGHRPICSSGSDWYDRPDLDGVLEEYFVDCLDSTSYGAGIVGEPGGSISGQISSDVATVGRVVAKDTHSSKEVSVYPVSFGPNGEFTVGGLWQGDWTLLIDRTGTLPDIWYGDVLDNEVQAGDPGADPQVITIGFEQDVDLGSISPLPSEVTDSPYLSVAFPADVASNPIRPGMRVYPEVWFDPTWPEAIRYNDSQGGQDFEASLQCRLVSGSDVIRDWTSGCATNGILAGTATGPQVLSLVGSPLALQVRANRPQMRTYLSPLTAPVEPVLLGKRAVTDTGRPFNILYQPKVGSFVQLQTSITPVANRYFELTDSTAANKALGIASGDIEWFVDGVAAGTGSVFYPEAAHAGKVLSVTASVGCGTSHTECVSRGPVPVDVILPDDTVPPDPEPMIVSGTKISGTAKVGSKLTAVAGTWPAGASVGYAWYRGATKVGTGSSYTVKAADVGKRITLKATGTLAGYETTVVSVDTAAKAIKGSLKAAKPKITGTARVGKTLKVKVGSWTAGVKRSVRWYANGKSLRGATKTSLKLTNSLKGKKIVVKIKGTKSGYVSRTVFSKATVKVKAKKR